MKGLLYRFFRKIDFSYLIALFASIIIAMLIGAGVMALVGYDPIDCYREMFVGAFRTPRMMGNTVAKSATLCVTGLAMAVAAKAGMFNVGGEGQLFFGAIASALAGVYCAGLHPALAILLAVLAAMAAGALLALFPAVLKVKLGISEVIVTILLNSAAILFCSYLASGPFKTAEAAIPMGTELVPEPFRFSQLVPLSNLTSSIFIVIIATLFIWYLMTKTAQGYEYKMTGHNDEFSRYSGIKNKRVAIVSMLISGALCGLVGMFEVYGSSYRFTPSISNEFYFDGMLVAMIMRYNPVGIVIMSIFFGMMKIGATWLETSVGMPSEIILVVQSIIIFFMAAENGITSFIKKKLAIRRAEQGVMYGNSSEVQ